MGTTSRFRASTLCTASRATARSLAPAALVSPPLCRDVESKSIVPAPAAPETSPAPPSMSIYDSPPPPLASPYPPAAFSAAALACSSASFELNVPMVLLGKKYVASLERSLQVEHRRGEGFSRSDVSFHLKHRRRGHRFIEFVENSPAGGGGEKPLLPRWSLTPLVCAEHSHTTRCSSLAKGALAGRERLPVVALRARPSSYARPSSCEPSERWTESRPERLAAFSRCGDPRGGSTCGASASKSWLRSTRGSWRARAILPTRYPQTWPR